MRLIIPVLVLGLVMCLTASSVDAASPFQKAGLSKNAGKVLTDKQADKVRGGFRGNEEVRGIVLGLLGFAEGAEPTRDEMRSAFQGIEDRDAFRAELQAALDAAGIERPTREGNGGRHRMRTRGSRTARSARMARRG